MSASRASVREVVTTGLAGSATGSAELNVPYLCRVLAVEVDYAPGLPGTTDLTVTNGSRTILTLSNSATDRIVMPRVPVQDATGADVTDRGDEPPLVNGFVTVTLAQTNAANPAATVKLHLVPA